MDEEKMNTEAAQENEAPKQEPKKAPPFPYRSAICSIRNFGAGTREDRFRL